MIFITASIVFLPIIYFGLKRALSFFNSCWINGVDKKRNVVCLSLWVVMSAICFTVVHFNLLNTMFYKTSFKIAALSGLIGIVHKMILFDLIFSLNGVFVHTALCFFPNIKNKNKV